jgi:hypothetical protein
LVYILVITPAVTRQFPGSAIFTLASESTGNVAGFESLQFIYFLTDIIFPVPG